MSWIEEFRKAYDEYPSQDNEGFVPHRGGFKCGFERGWHIQQQKIYEKDAEIERLKAELERERMRLAACGTAALGYFEGCHEDYKSASLDDVLRLREDLQRERTARLVLMEAIEFLSTNEAYEVEPSDPETGYFDSYQGPMVFAESVMKEVQSILAGKDGVE